MFALALRSHYIRRIFVFSAFAKIPVHLEDCLGIGSPRARLPIGCKGSEGGTSGPLNFQLLGVARPEVAGPGSFPEGNEKSSIL